MKRWVLVLSVILAICVAAVSFLWWWDPFLFPVPHKADVYTLDESLTRAADKPGRCDADSYYVRMNGNPLCITLNAASVDGPPRPLARVRFDRSDSKVTLDGQQASVLRAVVPRIEELTNEPSRTFVLVFRGSPLAVIPIDVLGNEGDVSVASFE